MGTNKMKGLKNKIMVVAATLALTLAAVAAAPAKARGQALSRQQLL